jgi:hypothetical protein
MQGNSFTFDSISFLPNVELSLQTQAGVETNQIIVSNSTWQAPRTITISPIAGGITNSWLINDTYAGSTTAERALK